jgi:tRNA wybutosine-synthesizing protein 1
MEATPSMACANKCTFCWRHNSNPTTTEWKWDVDDPIKLVEQMLAAHVGMVKNTGGVPGVTPDKLQEGMTPKHCALSLVGEPIIYPRVNEFVGELHRRGISTFLVNNGQFPDHINALAPITQLYLSVDAFDAKVMKEIGRPAFKDFWERFQSSVVNTSKKKGRTVHRLTMIKGVNMMLPSEEDVAGYAATVALGKPHLVEFKALTPTFQGAGDKTPFRMANVPSYEEVLDFAQKVCSHPDLKEQYEVACVHEHSRCVLLASKALRVNGVWHTWIDFEKFNELIAVQGADPKIEDYYLPTPEWCLFGSEDHGFDPMQTRHRKPSKKRVTTVADGSACASCNL